MTIDSKNIIKEMLQNNGTYPGDPQVSSIWKYQHFLGHETHAVFMSETHNDLFHSPYVVDCCLLWSREQGLTEAGKEFIK